MLEDLSSKYAPHEWAAKAIEANQRHKADRIVAEINNGGAMVEATIGALDPLVSFKSVHASRGKVVRAEPIAALYKQRKVHYVGNFPTLEDQMCAFTSDFDRARVGYSPDRVDALVWALTELSGPQRILSGGWSCGFRVSVVSLGVQPRNAQHTQSFRKHLRP